MNDVLIMGAGLAGLTAAWQAALRGKKVQIAAKGWGTTHWHAGCVDVLGYHPVDNPTAVDNPRTALTQLIADQPQHPYALAGLDQIEEALTALQTLCAEAGYPLHGSLDKNWQLPTAVGSMRPTCLAPSSMIAGDLTQKESPMLLIGFEHYHDFYPSLAADNLRQLGIEATGAKIKLATIEDANFMTPIKLAQRMDNDPNLRLELARGIQAKLGTAKRVGLPAILGVRHSIAIHKELEERLGVPVFEIPSLPPSVPGMRLHHILFTAIQQAGGRVYDGMEGIGSRKDGNRVTAVLTEAAGRTRTQRAATYVLATGGILGGGIVTYPDSTAREVVFDLPLAVPGKQHEWFRREFLNKDGHPIYHVGVQVNASFQPVQGENGTAVALYQNLYAIGNTLAHSEAIRQRAYEGVALVTGYKVGKKC